MILSSYMLLRGQAAWPPRGVVCPQGRQWGRGGGGNATPPFKPLTSRISPPVCLEICLSAGKLLVPPHLCLKTERAGPGRSHVLSMTSAIVIIIVYISPPCSRGRGPQRLTASQDASKNGRGEEVFDIIIIHAAPWASCLAP